MSLATGTTVGPYHVLARLGAGGMGEVYRARDKRLNRDVALKILPDLFAGDPDRLARFEREAQLLAALNHPNIAHIHGVEASSPGPRQSSLRALVMELVEGPTLAERIAAGGVASAGGLSQRDTNLMILPMEGSEEAGRKPGSPTAFLATPVPEFEPMFSPDGRWVAYSSFESGPRQVFVRPFSGSGGRWQVSTAGGSAPVWSRAAAELLFRGADGTIMTAAYVATSDTFRSEKPHPWMQGGPLDGVMHSFDLHPDGQRLAAPPMLTAADRPNTLSLVFNVVEELTRLAVPPGRP